MTGDGWTLHLGDCIAGLATLDDKSVDHVICDPPYDEHTHAAGRRGATGVVESETSKRATFNRTRDLGFAALRPDQMTDLGAHFGRVAKRWVAIFCSLEMVSDWKHSVGSTPQFTGDRPAVAAEAIVLAHPKGRKRWNAGGKHGFYEHPIVLNRGAGEVRCHTTQKPLALMKELIEDFSLPGDLILDPFAGSGTTGVAARMLGRRFLGWELSPAYHAIACRRLNGDEAVPNAAQPSLFGGVQ